MYKLLPFSAFSREIPVCDNLDVVLVVHSSVQGECACYLEGLEF